MDISIFLARFLGLYLLIMGLSMFLNAGSFKNVVNNVADNPAVLLLSGAVTLLLGTLLILVHNIWAWDWKLMITVIAWITFIKGILRTAFPKIPMKFMKKCVKNPRLYYLKTIIILVLGATLCYYGFWM